MKKHLLMLLALLAFILPARADEYDDITFYFQSKNKTGGYDSGSAIYNNAKVNDVFSAVTSDDASLNVQGTNNSAFFIESISGVNKVYVQAQNGTRIAAGGSLTFTTKDSYDISKITINAQNWNGATNAVITLNGQTFGPCTGNCTGSSDASVLQNFSVNVNTTGTNTFTVSSTQDVIIRYIRIEFAPKPYTLAAPVFSPKSGSAVKIGDVITITCPTIGSAISYYSDNSDLYPYVSEESNPVYITIAEGTDEVTFNAASHIGDKWTKYVSATYKVGATPTPKYPKPTFSPDGGTVGPETHVTVSCPVSTEYLLDVVGEGASVEDFGEYTFTLPKAAGTYTYTAKATADGYEDSDPATVTFTIPACPTPVFSPAGGTVAPGTQVTVSCPVSTDYLLDVVGEGASVKNLGEYTFTLPSKPGNYEYIAQASADGYADSNIATANYTVEVVVVPEVAPVISFSIADGSRLDAAKNHDVTLSLNANVNPVPDYIYYTLDGYKAHNTTNSPDEHTIYSVAVNKTTLKATEPVTIHADAHGLKTSADHKSLTINAWAKNSKGEDVAAATYTFLAEAPVAAASVAPRAASATPITLTAEQVKNSQTSGYTFTFSNNIVYDAKNKYYKFQQSNNLTIAAPTGQKMSAINIEWSANDSSKRTIGVTVDGKTGSDLSITKETGTNGTLKWTGSAEKIVLSFKSESGAKQIFLKSFEITPSGPVLEPVATPVISGATEGETYTADVTVSVRCETEGAAITLTDNGTPVTANANSTYTITGYSKHALVATASKDGMSDSEAKLNFTIKDPNAKDDVYKLVTDLSELTEGSEIIFATMENGSGKVMNTSFSNNSFSASEATSTNQEIVAADGNDYNVLTIEKVTVSGKEYTVLKLPTGKYLGGGSSTNLTNSNEPKDNYFATKCSVSYVKDGNAIKVSLGTTTTRAVIYNGSSVFKYYATSNWGTESYSKTYIYKKVVATTPTCEAPTFDKAAGSYETKVTVNISCKTEGATVHYQLNDGEAVEGTSVTISQVGENTLKAWATKEGMADSKVTTATYTIYLPTCAAVTVAGVDNNAEIQLPAYASLTFGCTTEGATVKYQLDGGEAATGTTLDVKTVGKHTVTVWAEKDGYNNSAETTVSFTILPETDLFLVMDSNDWDVRGTGDETWHPELAYPFTYKGDGVYELQLADIEAQGTHFGTTPAICGIMGAFAVRDGKANNKGLCLRAEGAATAARTLAYDASDYPNTKALKPGNDNAQTLVSGADGRMFMTAHTDGKLTRWQNGTLVVEYKAPGKSTNKIYLRDAETTGVESISAEDAAAGEAVYYNLQGVRVSAERLTPGLYIRQSGRSAEKVLVR